MGEVRDGLRFILFGELSISDQMVW